MKKMSQAQLRAMVRMLKRARVKIDAGLVSCICDGLSPTETPEEYGIRLYLQIWIMQMLGGKAWLESWVEERFKVSLTEKELKQIRLRWIDWMVDELRKEMK